ncbi:nose resistant to fluoxetine protein 6-like [Centruroides vittatus]|uniref:nose resistant to fluoxetine protein 6-like n=1 Tax=Centruroides vittatus TaxID=120091 RepID=UPI00350EB3D7
MEFRIIQANLYNFFEFQKPYPVSKVLEIADFTEYVYRMDICIPSTCNRKDVENILQWAVKGPYRAEVKFCKVKDEKVLFSSTQIICIITISIFILCVFSGTILDTLFTLNLVNVPCGKGHILHNFVSFSLITSTQNLFSTDSDSETRFLCGMKFLLLCLEVYSHIPLFIVISYTTTEQFNNFPNMSSNVFLEVISQALSMIEIYFFLSGFLTFYLRRVDKKRPALYYLMFLIQRYIRLTIPLLCLFVFFMLLPLSGEGPHWDLVYKEAENVEKYWWRYILQIQNFYNINLTFSSHTWFLNVLMQLTVITVPLLYIRDRWPRIGTVLLCILTMAGIISHTSQLLITKCIFILGLSINLENFGKLLENIYSKPYFSHLSSYCLGLLIGHVLAEKKQLKFRKTIVVSFWIATICLMGLAFFGLHNYRVDPSPNESIILAHQILSPFAWTAIIAWICVACISEYGGILSKFLSSDFFLIMDRLTLWIYILHPLSILYIYGQRRNHQVFREIYLWMLYIMAMFISIIVSVFCYTFLQIPISNIVVKIFSPESSKKNAHLGNKNSTEEALEKKVS